MKTFTLIFFSLFIYGVSNAQNGVSDTHPLSQIFIINYQNGQEEQASGDGAILFKDAFIDLVRNTDISRQILGATQGRKVAVIKQIDPQKLNGYQLTWESVSGGGQNSALCTFYYNIDQNSLYYYDPNQRDWTAVNINGGNINNLNNCQDYCKFNSNSSSVPDLSVTGGSQVPDLSVSNQPVSDDQASQQDVSANSAPPALPEYQQPACPVDGYLWQPGYWAYSPRVNDYYWVPGVWVGPPNPGLYWTPCYWGYDGGYYRFHRGYWGASVGFYGGINYGYGYVGVGYVGGVWHGRDFSYNTAVVRVNTTVIHNTYVNNTVINNTTVVNRTSFNGRGGVTTTPTVQEQVAMRQPHVNPTAAQLTHQQVAVADKSQFASVNNGRPTTTAVAKINPPSASVRSNISQSQNGGRGPANQNNTNSNNNKAVTPNGGRTPAPQTATSPNTNGNNTAIPNGNRTPGNKTNANPNPNANGNKTPMGQPDLSPGGNAPSPNGRNSANPITTNPNPNKNTATPNGNRIPSNQPNVTPNNKPVNNNTPNTVRQQRPQRQQRLQPAPKQQAKPSEKEKN